MFCLHNVMLHKQAISFVTIEMRVAFKGSDWWDSIFICNVNINIQYHGKFNSACIQVCFTHGPGEVQEPFISTQKFQPIVPLKSVSNSLE